jgi:hypothetical protein
MTDPKPSPLEVDEDADDEELEGYDDEQPLVDPDEFGR